MSEPTKRKRTTSLKELSNKERLSKKEESPKKCTEEDTATPLAIKSIQETLARVISQQEKCQASIDHLLDMCLQEEPEGYLEKDH